MRCRRSFAALTTAVLLVVSSGCGGENKKDSSSTGSGGQGAAANKGPIDLSLVTPDDFAAIVIRPRRIAQSPLVAELLKDETITERIKKFGIDPSEVEQIVVLLRMVAIQPGQREQMPVTIVRFTHDVDAKEVLTKVQAAGPPGAEPIREVKVGGKTCFDLGGPDAPMAYAPSKNSIVLTSKESMAAVVSAAEPKGPLLERLQKAEPDNDVIVVLKPDAVPDIDSFIKAAKKGTPPLDLGAAKGLQGGTATFNLTAPSMLRAVLDAKDAEAAGNVNEMLQQAMRLAGGGLALAKQGLPKEDQARFAPLLKLANQLLDGAKTTKSGSQVTLDVKRPEILDSAGASIIAAVQQSMMEARTADRRNQQMYNMKHISVAMLNYESVYQSFPPATIEKDGKPLLSWRVAILPYLGQRALFGQFHLDEPWDSPHNVEVAKKMPPIFQSPDSPSEGKTRVMLFTGRGAAFDGGKQIRMMDIRDGTSATLLCVEAGPEKAVPWTKPEDLPFDPENPLAALGKVSPQGFIAAFFDGSVQQLNVDNQTLKALITPDGGERVDFSKLRGGR